MTDDDAKRTSTRTVVRQAGGHGQPCVAQVDAWKPAALVARADDETAGVAGRRVVARPANAGACARTETAV